MIVILPLNQKSPSLSEIVDAFNLTPTDTVIAILDRCPVPSPLPDGIILLKNRLPRGKGSCIKTALAYMQDHPMPDEHLLIWMDGHLPSSETIPSAEKFLQKVPTALVSGRILQQYHGSNLMRRCGYFLTRYAFAFGTGLRLQDLSPAFLACSCSYLSKLLELSGDMQSYITHVLLTFAQEDIALIELDAQPSYVSHEKPALFYGFWRAYFPFLQYTTSSFIAFSIEYLLFLLLVYYTRNIQAEAMALLFCTVVARVCSCMLNFFINRRIVFKHNGALWPAVLKFGSVAAIILIMHALLLQLLVSVLGIAEAIAFLISGIVFFAVGSLLQRLLVFPHTKTN